MAEFKTNVMRILDKAKVKYSALEYPHEDGVCVDGVTVAELVGIDLREFSKRLLRKVRQRRILYLSFPLRKNLI